MLMTPAYHWLGYQFFGKDPDFRKLRTRGWYALFLPFSGRSIRCSVNVSMYSLHEVDIIDQMHDVIVSAMINPTVTRSR